MLAGQVPYSGSTAMTCQNMASLTRRMLMTLSILMLLVQSPGLLVSKLVMVSKPSVAAATIFTSVIRHHAKQLVLAYQEDAGWQDMESMYGSKPTSDSNGTMIPPTT